MVAGLVLTEDQASLIKATVAGRVDQVSEWEGMIGPKQATLEWNFSQAAPVPIYKRPAVRGP
ncbi:hypothetical protein GCM10011247_27200 [Pseudomonas plecoglossicida]|uniref:Uncharacterized protein n=1 Tax=Pseudomonas plecoglossicida TaxID=70775 RepID=A0AAD0VTC2_PSEDL|nr:hypothetical protein DVB73_09510 [Pseudomonas plecoglossicida]GLR37323.1 hypothetical protein GCM10011247_27200 [Pseudomonas plecoglossicida]